MPTNLECVCCKEIASVVGKLDVLEDPTVTCITNHPGFETVCLDVWVLQTAYYQFRQEHGPYVAATLHE